MRWRCEPASWRLVPDGIELRTKPRTDFWRHTHYGFVRDDGHLYYEQADGDLEVEATIDGDYRDQYDQAGVMLRVDEETWVKCGIEFVDGRELISAVVTRGASDWAVSPRPLKEQGTPLRIVARRTGDAVTVLHGHAGAEQLLRLAPFPRGPVMAGVMAASPDGAGCHIALTRIAIQAPASRT
jgi:uncharacterized protein